MIQFISGAFAGLTQVILGHHLEYIKVKHQTSTLANRNIHLSFENQYKKIHKQINEKKFRYFRGLSLALIGGPLAIGFQFMTNDYIRRNLMENLGRSSLQTPQHVLDLKYIGLSGMISGILTSFILCPLQFVKINRQIATTYKEGPFNTISNLLKNDKGSQLFRGLKTTMMRQAIGGYAYFLTYQYIIRSLCNYKKKKRQLAGSAQFMIGGASAGFVYWGLTYPVDLIKTRIQLRMSKIPFSFYGCDVAIIRGALVNAVAFLIYQQIRAYGKIVELLTKA